MAATVDSWFMLSSMPNKILWKEKLTIPMSVIKKHAHITKQKVWFKQRRFTKYLPTKILNSRLLSILGLSQLLSKLINPSSNTTKVELLAPAVVARLIMVSSSSDMELATGLSKILGAPHGENKDTSELLMWLELESVVSTLELNMQLLTE